MNSLVDIPTAPATASCSGDGRDPSAAPCDDSGAPLSAPNFTPSPIVVCVPLWPLASSYFFVLTLLLPPAPPRPLSTATSSATLLSSARAASKTPAPCCFAGGVVPGAASRSPMAQLTSLRASNRASRRTARALWDCSKVNSWRRFSSSFSSSTGAFGGVAERGVFGVQD